MRWLSAALGGVSDEAARGTGDAMIYLGLLHHVTFEHMLHNSPALLYRFSPQLSRCNASLVQEVVRAHPRLRAWKAATSKASARLDVEASAWCPRPSSHGLWRRSAALRQCWKPKPYEPIATHLWEGRCL